jgi:hypothetical protein
MFGFVFLQPAFHGQLQPEWTHAMHHVGEVTGREEIQPRQSARTSAASTG